MIGLNPTSQVRLYQIMRYSGFVPVLLSVCIILSACSKSQTPVVQGGPPLTGTGHAGNKFSRPSAGADYGSPEENVGPLSRRTIYFMYESDEVRPEYQELISAHAAYLVLHPGRHIILEGHTDERGSQEYNIALGERRARAVLRLLRLQGVGDDQVQLVSFGEEKLADQGRAEASCDRNCRVEIFYPGL